MSYVWHLSKNWRPEWGGALYWAQNDHAVAAYPNPDPNPNPHPDPNPNPNQVDAVVASCDVDGNGSIV